MLRYQQGQTACAGTLQASEVDRVRVRLAPVRAMPPNLVVQAVVVVLLGVDHHQVALILVSWVTGPEIVLCIDGFLLLDRQLYQQHV